MAQAASKTCEICVSTSASHYCLECEQYFCENCKTFHKRQKVTKNHQFQSSSEVIPEAYGSITQLKETITQDLRRKVHEATQNIQNIEEGLQEFDLKVEVVVKAITEEGTKVKAMVNKCIAQMIASGKDQSRTEKDKFTTILAETRKDLKAGSDLDKKLYELDKKLNDENLLQFLQKLTDSIGKLMTEPISVYPCVQYTAKSATENDIK
ncbi:unnamed protein product [Mytilus coruscus]|uniref:B box-type domain-containing protein n=1 Tax=Mytilus coruscus TaxID=42192 RepID=A0A6J7ZUH4_MYTCO|nr:unnamed protein product [Mytilus coruscus]